MFSDDDSCLHFQKVCAQRRSSGSPPFVTSQGGLIPHRYLSQLSDPILPFAHPLVDLYICVMRLILCQYLYLTLGVSQFPSFLLQRSVPAGVEWGSSSRNGPRVIKS